MILPPRELLFRLVFWIAAFGWAVWKLGDLATHELVVPDLLMPPPEHMPPPAPRVRTLPITPGPPRADAADVADPALAATTLRDVAPALRACGVHGMVGVRLGERGLAEAWVRDLGAPLDDAGASCAARALDAGTWPAGRLEFEVEERVSP
jgi:hypothetical protein